MPLREAEAIVLHGYPLGEADRLVSLFTRSEGRLRGVAQGARRTKSRFGATLELLSHTRVWFYERETRELVRINQCELIESFLDVQKDYSAGVALSLMAEITETVLPEREPSDAAFRLLLLSAKAIKDSLKTEVPLAYFTLWSVRLAGWLPDLNRCARCGASLEASSGFTSIFPAGIFCRRCRAQSMHSISSAALSAARQMFLERLGRISGSPEPEAAAREISAFALDLVEHQIEKRLKTRQLMESIA